MTVRPADPRRDAEACAAIYAASVVDSHTSFETEPPTPAEMADRIARVSASHCWLVEEVDGAIAGYAYGSGHRPRAAYRWAVEVTVYVDAAFHRRGVGRRLYAALFERLRERGYRMAFAGIALPNDASVRLHESLGFEPIGVFRNVGWKLGAWRDVGWWQLDLAPGSDAPPREPGVRP